MAQTFTQRGFLETRAVLFPREGINDSAHSTGEALFRWEASWRPFNGLQVSGSLDARTDSHRQFERQWRMDWRDRSTRRPAFSLRRLSASYRRGEWSMELGKQFIRWGKADILTPTDRFAPRDYLNVIDNDLLAVQAGRLTWEGSSDTIDLVAAPLFTPSRTPLFNQRWVVLPEELRSYPLRDLGARIPGRTQFGARWSRLGRGFDYSLVFYDGFHHLPLLDGGPGFDPFEVRFQRYYPQLRLYGADASAPLPWFTVKGEAAWFRSRTPSADEYVLYVIQLERNLGEWLFVGGYSGEAVTQRRGPLDFAPDRGIARSFLGRASYTIDPRRSVAFESAVRQSGDGLWVKGEYSHLLGQHWRATAAFTLIRGTRNDFLGQYHLNSHAILALRYSF